MGYIGSSCSVMVVGGFERDGGIGLDLENNEIGRASCRERVWR